MEELYKKYRPKTFDEIVGNETAIKTLRKEIENGVRVFLMTGPAGCGKTTIARILSTTVGAGPLGIHEVNSAENRGIDTARDIMEQMRYAPSDGNALVWILDEMHMITSAGQNALLKALEDTPPHVYFFLCTTDPQKLIAPLKTRCSIVNVKPLSDSEMAYLLKRTARAEKIKVGGDVYEKIVQMAQGGSRKGLKLLSKVLFLENDEERIAALEGCDENAENAETIELCRELMKKKTSWANLAGLVKRIDTGDPERIRQGVMGYMNAVLLGGTANAQSVAAMQAFGNADTYRNGKNAITIALLDYLDMVNG